jgi:hypothetical protein
MGGNDDADLGQDQEWLRESDLINGGLIIIGVYMVQPFLTAASLDLPARVCVVAFSVAIPLLAALVLVNRRELSRHRATSGPGRWFRGLRVASGHLQGAQVEALATSMAVYCHTVPLVPERRPMQKQSGWTSSPG